ncbi:aryl-alcohol dehydrogenase-like predicted oxidoreductase [Anaerosolibacter carboniphilus]|uniref:Aryl-alcohol dehydrogenase-like predicted oxidoreductase n=1 Tax=Anaerosolibacter carboniphilus TaxID=1417629 RepID=A0A841KVU2_9FIRM|nr:aldo/keto reductase [Anaerosolibacter carboniphilus]MBB6214295.1 aryl-alcohol dehydrogenase-like predicted oxidoreductase [Anaerosolibacter carboniphilus]
MLYKKVAKIEENISAIGMGCWNFGGQWDNAVGDNTIKIVHAAIDSGINLFDVAPVYGFGKAEEILGRTLKEGKRSKILIASKCGLVWNDQQEISNNLTKKSILNEIDQSLRRLQTDYIDIYQLHWPDPSTPIEETVCALEEIKNAGKIRYIGLSNFAQRDVDKFMSMIDIHAQQSLYNMLERNTNSYHEIPLVYKTEDEVLPMVKKHQQAFLPYSPLFQGLLTGAFKRGGNFSENDIRNANPKLKGDLFEKYYEGALAIGDFADKIGRPLNEVAFNWLRQKEEVTSIIAGVSSISQLERNINSTTWNLTEEELREIETIIEPFKTI